MTDVLSGNPSFRNALKRDLIRDEGLRLYPYACPAGDLTIGVGHNLTRGGITEKQALALLDDDIAGIARDLDRNVPWWRGLPDGVRRGLLNMAFNLGWPRLSGFVKMLRALEAGDWAGAADEALRSRWAEQVGDRAQRIADAIRTGGDR